MNNITLTDQELLDIGVFPGSIEPEYRQEPTRTRTIECRPVDEEAFFRSCVLGKRPLESPVSCRSASPPTFEQHLQDRINDLEEERRILRRTIASIWRTANYAVIQDETYKAHCASIGWSNATVLLKECDNKLARAGAERIGELDVDTTELQRDFQSLEKKVAKNFLVKLADKIMDEHDKL